MLEMFNMFRRHSDFKFEGPSRPSDSATVGFTKALATSGLLVLDMLSDLQQRRHAGTSVVPLATTLR